MGCGGDGLACNMQGVIKAINGCLVATTYLAAAFLAIVCSDSLPAAAGHSLTSSIKLQHGW